MKNKSAVIQYQDLDGSFHVDKAGEGPSVKHLCLRLDARSRKKLVEAMAVEMNGNYQHNLIAAEAVLSTLEKLAEEK